MKNTILVSNLIISILWIFACTQTYEPPLIKEDNRLLVVEGFINAGNQLTIIKLSRTWRLGDSVTSRPEPFANVFVEEEGGTRYYLFGGFDGVYASGSLPISADKKYRLVITTQDNKSYVSDYVPVKLTPPIDSITWQQPRDLNIYVYTHDPANNSKYYRWDFTETWEYHSFYDTDIGYANGGLYFKDSSELVTVCWTSAESQAAVLGTSAQLSQDIINGVLVNTVPNGSGKVSVRYSILVRQYAITKEAFEYWQLIKKNTQLSGTLFDALPSVLISNIHCMTDPDEPVIGFVSAGTVTEKRIFIRKFELSNWSVPEPTEYCAPIFIDPLNVSNYLSDTSLAPAYYLTGGILAIAKKSCVDCTQKGGTTLKPSFW